MWCSYCSSHLHKLLDFSWHEMTLCEIWFICRLVAIASGSVTKEYHLQCSSCTSRAMIRGSNRNCNNSNCNNSPLTLGKKLKAVDGWKFLLHLNLSRELNQPTGAGRKGKTENGSSRKADVFVMLSLSHLLFVLFNYLSTLRTAQ